MTKASKQTIPPVASLILVSSVIPKLLLRNLIIVTIFKVFEDNFLLILDSTLEGIFQLSEKENVARVNRLPISEFF